MANEITNWDDVIDSRDVIERIAELEELLADDLIEEQDHAELLALRDLAEEGAATTDDWAHGATLIRDTYFVDYAKDLADDMGVLGDPQWPYTCIDWDEAAHDLQQDYTCIDFDGVDYWVR